jgi:hypothetical protein
MQDVRSRVTVVGARRRVDVAVPSAAPIGEYVAGLADLCGQDRRDALPAAWSLALAAGPPLPLGESLAAVGVVDGQVLYLRDAATDPDDVPVVLDIDEAVMASAERLRDYGVRRGLLVTGIGLAWSAAAAVLLWTMPPAAWMTAAVGLALGGLALVLLGWGLERRRAALPPGLLLALSLSATPGFAVAGGLLGDAVAGSAVRWPGALLGANLAVLLALSATPQGALIALELSLALAAVLAPGLVAAHADATQSATAAAVAALAVLALSRRIAALIAVFGQASTEPVDLLARTRRLLLVVLLGPVCTLLVTLPLLGRSGNGWAVAFEVVIAFGLLGRANQAVVPIESTLLAGAGAAGLFGLASVWLLDPSTAGWGVALVVLAGLAAVGVGVGFALAAPPDGGPREQTGPPRKRVVDYVGLACLALSAPLALGALGILGALVDQGRQILQ